MKNNKYKLCAALGLLFICLFCGGCDSDQPKTYTVSLLTRDGETVQQWSGAKIKRARTGWVRFTVEGKQVVIDGPHMWEEE